MSRPNPFPSGAEHEDMRPYLLEPAQEAECRLAQHLCIIDDCNLWVTMHRYGSRFQFLDCPHHGTVAFAETAVISDYRPGAPF